MMEFAEENITFKQKLDAFNFKPLDNESKYLEQKNDADI